MIKTDKIQSQMDQLYKALELAVEERRDIAEKFERLLNHTFIQAVLKKFPEDVRERVSRLSKEAEKDTAKQEILNNELAEWLNDEEKQRLFDKTAEIIFKQFLQHKYEEASVDHKKALESTFGIDILKEQV